MNSRFFIFILFFFPYFLIGNANNTYLKQQEVILPRVKGLIISGDNYPPPDYVIKTTRGVLFYRIRCPKNMSDQVCFSSSLERRIMNRSITFCDIERYKQEISNYYLKHCNIHVSVILPEQDCTSGVITLQVIESRVGDISVTGNYWFTKDHYLNYITLQPNDLVDRKELVANLNRINSSPWQKADIVYKRGKNPCETDIELVVVDKKPIQFYGGGDNTGFRITQFSRMYVGFNWGNAFNLDQIIAFCYTTSPDFQSYQSYTLDYSIPLPNDDGLRIFGGYARTQANNKYIPFAVSAGQSWQVSGRYNYQLPQSLKVNQKFHVGLDYKSTNNDFIVGENTISNLFATIFQIAAEYDGKITLGPHKVYGKIAGYGQPWKFGSISNIAYESLRPGANPLYVLSRGSGTYAYNEDNHNEFSFKVRVMGQVASTSLLPIEQYGLGGINSVRGYVAREVNVDNAIVVNLDIQTPKTSLIRLVSNKDRNIDKLSGVVFFDVGNGWLNSTVENQPYYYFLAGTGPGIRYDIANNIYALFDLGIRLGNIPFGATYDSRFRFYFSVIGTY